MRTTPARLLHSTTAAPPPASSAIAIDSDTVVILASLLCALICVAGLALVARCACRRPPTTTTGNTPRAPPPKGLKKVAINALPTTAAVQGDCAICLVDFIAGEELRVLPRCAHAFHVACIDTWLGAHATCPSCRATIGSSSPPPLPGRCRRCGATCDDDVATAARDEGSFLP